MSYIFTFLSKIKSLYRSVYRLRNSINNLYASSLNLTVDYNVWKCLRLFRLNQGISRGQLSYTNIHSDTGPINFKVICIWDSYWSVFILFAHASSNILKQVWISWSLLKSRWYFCKLVSSQLYPWQLLFRDWLML